MFFFSQNNHGSNVSYSFVTIDTTPLRNNMKRFPKNCIFILLATMGSHKFNVSISVDVLNYDGEDRLYNTPLMPLCLGNCQA